MFSFLIPILNWVLSVLPLEDILKCFIIALRAIAKSTSSQVDDKAVDFLELVFISLGWMSNDASNVSTPVGQASASKQKIPAI